MLDGNFKSEHLKMRNPKDDVFLRNGVGYMANHEEYEAFLKVAPQPTKRKGSKSKVITFT
jgi:hypothetical protein